MIRKEEKKSICELGSQGTVLERVFFPSKMISWCDRPPPATL